MNNEQFRSNKETSDEAISPNYLRTGKIRASETTDIPEERQFHNRSERLEGAGSGFNNLYLALGAGLAGVGAGLAAMYFLDPRGGGRRRAILSDKIASAVNQLPRAVRVTAVDLSNRSRGTWASISNLFSSDNADDQVVEARVRSKLGRVCSHPHAIRTTSVDGNITLEGVILASEVPDVLKCVTRVRGVTGVNDRLRKFDSPEGISSLQGGSHRERRSEFMQSNWSPAARFVAGTAGISALTYALLKRDLIGLGLGAAGAAVLARSLSNLEFSRLAGLSGGRAAVTVDKSINVAASRDVLWALWSNFENFPQFMSNVLEVRNINDNISHWKVAGPAGVPVEWDAEITETVPNEMIAWKSVEGSTIPNAGYVLFEPNDDGTTEVNVRISYNPPSGALGHAIAKAFGADPKAEMDADLMRMKSLLETGHIPHDAAQNVFTTQKGQHLH
jgi:uncharacterized membrane protein